MKRMLLVMGLLGLAVGLIPTLAFSNVAVPPDPHVPFKITADKTTRENRLVIPRKFLEKSGSVGLGGAADDGSNLRTVIAGLAISVSVASLVFLLIRRKHRAAQALTLLAALGGAGFVWVNCASADLPPSISRIPQQWTRVAKGDQNVVIKITDKGDAVELILGTKYRGSGGKRRPEPEPPRSNAETNAEPKAQPKPE